MNNKIVFVKFNNFNKYATNKGNMSIFQEKE